MVNYAFSLSVIPSRLPYIEPCLHSLLMQDWPASRIIVNIPKEYSRFKEIPDLRVIDIISNLSPKICINRGIDYGPGTKLLGALEVINNSIDNNENYLIVVDDDTIYPKDMAMSIMMTAFEHGPGHAVSRHVYKLPFRTMSSTGFKVGKGCNGFCFPLNDRLLNPKTGIRAFSEVIHKNRRIFLDDDVWMSFFLMLKGIDIIQATFDSGKEITYNDSDALSRITSLQQFEIITDICKIRESVRSLVEMKENSEFNNFINLECKESSTKCYQANRILSITSVVSMISMLIYFI